MAGTSTSNDYRKRFTRVLEHIDAHLDEPLSVDRLASIAAYSPFHFHRQFSAVVGLGVSRYVQLSRLRRASYQLAFRQTPIGEIALANGYENAESFSRAFRKTLGQSPTEFRLSPDWTRWQDATANLTNIRRQHMNTDTAAEQVTIVDFPETRLASLTHRGAPHTIGQTIRRFIEWRRENGLSPRVSRTFNIVYERPGDVPPDAFRLEICATIDRDVPENGAGIIERVIPAGRCAVLRHVGSDEHLEDVVMRLYADWLPGSGEEPREFPLFFERIAFFPDVPEHEAVTDVYLPLR